MRRGMGVAIVLAAILAGCYTEPYVQHARRPIQKPDAVGVLTNHDIIALSNAGIPDSVIINLMEVSEAGFRLRPNDVIALTDSGVSSSVVHAMITRAGTSAGEVGRTGDEYYRAYGWCWSCLYYGGWYPWYPALYFGFPEYYGTWYARTHFAPWPRFSIDRGLYRFRHMRMDGGARRWGGHRR